jgi:hypothetical protein
VVNEAVRRLTNNGSAEGPSRPRTKGSMGLAAEPSLWVTGEERVDNARVRRGEAAARGC